MPLFQDKKGEKGEQPFVLWKHSQAQSQECNKTQFSCGFMSGWHKPSAVFIFPAPLSVTQLRVQKLAVFDTQELQWFTSCVIHHNWISMWKKIKVSSYSYLQSSAFFFFNWVFHRSSRINNIFQNMAKSSFPSQMLTNWSRPPLWEQVTHCRGMHNLPMNCYIFCPFYLHFSKGKKKKTQVFPDKYIFCFWWMKLETANKFTLGTGMKPSICFTWVPSDGKKYIS